MAKSLPILDIKGKEAGSVDLLDGWLEREKGAQAVHETVVAFLAGLRAGTACTKTRGKVRGGGAKPYRQKGTGRARAGSTRSPIWRGGGTTFGPQPRSYSKKINRKVGLLALRRAFTERVDEGSVIVVDTLELEDAKTKSMLAALNGVGAGQDVLVIVEDYDEKVLLAARNLPRVEVMKASAVNPYWLLLFKKVVFTNAAVQLFGQRLSPGENA